MTYTSRTATRLALAALLAAPGAFAAQTGPAQDPGRQAFGKADADHDGTVSLPEFQALGGKEQAFRAGDGNRDQRLDYNEFVKANDGRIKTGQYLDDTTITAKIKALLLKDEQVKGLDVSVKTLAGEVQLSGWVDSPAQIARAGKIAASVAGVKTVRNDLQIKG